MATPTCGILTCSQEEYLADPMPGPSLNQSTATVLLTQSPLHAWSQHPRLGAVARPASAAMDRGSLIHRLLLGKGDDIFIVEAADWRTKAAQEIRNECRVTGKLAVLEGEFVAAKAVSAILAIRFLAAGVDFKGGEAEVMVTWTETTKAGVEVVCRGQFDYLLPDGRLIDLKTTRSAHPRSVARSFMDYGYDVQWAAYTSALNKLRPELKGQVEMVFAFGETESPCGVYCCQPAGGFREIGESRWNAAVEKWAECLSENKWPGYATTIEALQPPSWAMSTLTDGVEI